MRQPLGLLPCRLPLAARSVIVVAVVAAGAGRGSYGEPGPAERTKIRSRDSLMVVGIATKGTKVVRSSDRRVPPTAVTTLHSRRTP